MSSMAIQVLRKNCFIVAPSAGGARFGLVREYRIRAAKGNENLEVSQFDVRAWLQSLCENPGFRQGTISQVAEKRLNRAKSVFC